MNGLVIGKEKASLKTWSVVLGFCAVSALLVLPVVLNPFLPMIDIPNHMARLEILANRNDPFFIRYYQFEPGAISNSTMDIFVRLSGWKGDVYALTRWSVAFYLVNFLLSALVLYRIFWGRWSLWPLAAGLVAYSGPFFWGFQNFFIAVPFAIYTLALWIWCVKYPVIVRVLLLAVPVSLVYVMHSIAFAIVAISVGGFEIQKWLEGGLRDIVRKTLVALGLTIPFWFPVFHFLRSMGSDARLSGKSEFGGIFSRLDAIVSITGTPAIDLYHWVQWANLATLLLLVLPVFMFSKFGSALRIHKSAHGILVALMLAALLAPEWISGVWGTHIRLPFVLFLVFVSAADWPGLSRRYQIVLATTLSLALLLRVVSFDAYARLYSEETADLFTLFEALDDGVSLGNSPVSEREVQDFQWRRHNLEKYAIIEKRAFVPDLFEGTHGVSVIREGAAYASRQNRSQRCAGVDLGGARQYFRKDFMLHIGQIPNEYRENPLFQPVAANDVFSLYEACRNTP
ncbi:MAG: hypothetical protein ACC631_05025 [Halocynthiibacter sp.]